IGRVSRCFLITHTSTPELYTLSLHDALPIWRLCHAVVVATRWRSTDDEEVYACTDKGIEERVDVLVDRPHDDLENRIGYRTFRRSEEHTSELQSRENLVCRLLLEKKKTREAQ